MKKKKDLKKKTNNFRHTSHTKLMVEPLKLLSAELGNKYIPEAELRLGKRLVEELESR